MRQETTSPIVLAHARTTEGVAFQLRRDSKGVLEVPGLANVLISNEQEALSWAMKREMDTLFGVEWAEWLDRTRPGSRGVRRLGEANLFFPEEMPDLIAEEAEMLWNLRR